MYQKIVALGEGKEECESNTRLKQKEGLTRWGGLRAAAAVTRST